MTFTWIQGVFFAFLKCFGVESAEATMDSNMKPHACEGNSSSRNKKSFQDTSNPSLPDTQTLNASSTENRSNMSQFLNYYLICHQWNDD
ncbi:unnamed protein product [Lathyrus oleraceus]